MFEKVLVPTDFSRYTGKMLECISEIPGLKEVVLLNVIDASNPKLLEKSGWSYDSVIDEAAARLDEQASILSGITGKRAGPLKIRTVLKIIVEPMSGADGVDLKKLEPGSNAGMIYGGSVGDAIQKTAIEENVSLIIIGAQGKGLVEGILLGSVSTDVLRHGQTDLLIIRHRILGGGEVSLEKFCPDIFSRVLVATDFSPAADDALSLATGLEGIREMLLVNVISREEEFNKAAEKLNLMREKMEHPDRKVTVHVLSGNPADKILNLAREEGVSLIILSSQGKGWVKQIRVGSTSFDIARRSDRPVLIVRQKG